MQEREREVPRPDPTTPPSPEGPPLDEARAAGERLLSEADRAIARSLSADHRAFNQMNRQQIGQ